MGISTPTPRSRYTPRSGQSPDFEVGSLKSAGARSNSANAAGAVNTSSIYSSLRENAPNSADMAVTAAANRMKERVSVEKAEASMAVAGMDAAAAVEKADIQAESIAKQAAAKEKGGMMSAMGGILGAVIPMFSDETTKHSISEIEDALEILRELRPVSFCYKAGYSNDTERAHNGFIAQEYQKVLPDATYTEAIGGKLCIDTADVIALNVRAIQQLEAKVAKLEKELAEHVCVK